MTFLKTPTMTLLALITFTSAAAAQTADMDVNGDGMYSFPELQAAMPDMSDVTFVTLDVSGDGLLDADEIEAGVAAGLLPPAEG